MGGVGRGFEEYFFDRVDEGDDALFYREPRLVVHIDDAAIAEVGRIFRELLPVNGVILDLMSSWRSHLPSDFVKGRMVGLGLNAVEMEDNPQLDEYVVHDVNRTSRLPFEDASFHGVILTVSVQYLTRPVDVFRDVARVLRPGAPLVVTFSNRMFPTKAVRIWQACSDEQRMTLVKMYLQRAGGFEGIRGEDRSPGPRGFSDPVYLVTGRRGTEWGGAEGVVVEAMGVGIAGGRLASRPYQRLGEGESPPSQSSPIEGEEVRGEGIRGFGVGLVVGGGGRR